jgi:hypothetical protein
MAVEYDALITYVPDNCTNRGEQTGNRQTIWLEKARRVFVVIKNRVSDNMVLSIKLTSGNSRVF